METTASIIAVTQLCEKVIKYIIAVSGAKEVKHRLRSQVRACSNLLLQLQDDVADSDELEEWSKTLKLLSTPLARLQEALSLAAVALSTRDGIVEKLGWPFREKDVEKLIEAIKCEMDMVTFALHNNATSLLIEINTSSKRNEQHLTYVKSALGLYVEKTHSTLRSINGELVSIQTTQNGVRGRVEELHDRQDTEEAMRERQRIFDWLTPIDHASDQRDAISRRQPGTGGWLLHSQTYKDWLSTDNRTLFCPGIPGAGKTVFASIINADLQERYHHDPTVGLAHLFCNYRRHSEQTLEALLSALLKQLVEHQVPLPECVVDFHKKPPPKGTLDRIEATMVTLKSVAATYSRVFIVVDALDECSTSHGCRTTLLSSIQSLQKQCHINLLATSRFIPEITEKFKTACHLKIQADNNDVRRYLSENMTRLPGFVQRDEVLQEEVVSKIVEAVRGMFLLAKLHLDSLIGKRAVKAVKFTLRRLATGSEAYDSAYDSAMKRIEGQFADQTELAKQALAFLTCAQRPLSTRQLREALAVEIGKPELDPDNYPDIEDVLASCVGLVTVDDNSGIIRLVHYTTQEYLKRTLDQWFPDAQAMITNVCTSYLSLDRYGNPNNPGPFANHVWYDYSAAHWGHHARLAPSSLQRVVGFLTRQTNVMRCYIYTYTGRRRLATDGFRSIYDHQDFYTTGIHIAILHSLEDITVTLIQQGSDLDSRNEFGRTPLTWAASKGNKRLTDKLVAYNSPIDARIDENNRFAGCTALHVAAILGHTSIVELLLERGAAVNSKDVDDATPLYNAVKHRRTEIVKILIEAGADRTCTSKRLWRPLLTEAIHWTPKLEIVQLLLDAGVDVNERQDKILRTALFYAVQYDKGERIVRMLLEAGADPNIASRSGRTPLILGIMRYHQDESIALAKLLLDAGADIDIQDRYGYTAYQWTRKYHLSKTGQYLLERGANPELGSQRRPGSAVPSGD